VKQGANRFDVAASKCSDGETGAPKTGRPRMRQNQRRRRTLAAVQGTAKDCPCGRTLPNKARVRGISAMAKVSLIESAM